MTRGARTTQRMLAIDPTPRGFGFVVLEGPNRLVDWGVKDVRTNKEAATLKKVHELIGLYRPDVLVTEDCDDRSSRRGPRVQALIRKLQAEAARLNVKSRPVSIWRAHAAFAITGKANKYRIAEAICGRFPELALRRPRLRKPWMSEDERQAVFDAVTFGLTQLVHLRGS
jgi:hypothetical protein